MYVRTYGASTLVRPPRTPTPNEDRMCVTCVTEAIIRISNGRGRQCEHNESASRGCVVTAEHCGHARAVEGDPQMPRAVVFAKGNFATQTKNQTENCKTWNALPARSCMNLSGKMPFGRHAGRSTMSAP